MNNKLWRTVATPLLTGSAVALAATRAGAISVTDLAAVPKEGISTSATVPQYAWDGWNGVTPNLGWAHNSQWYTFTLPRKITVEIKMSSADAGMHPAFSVWKTTGDFVGTDHNSHSYNQIALGGASKFLRPAAPGGNGTTAFVAYSNAGTRFTNGDSKAVQFGTPGRSARNAHTAAIAVTLDAGQYLIAAGGSCNKADCGNPAPKAFQLGIKRLPILD